MAGKSAVLTVAVVTDASAVPKGLASASASYGKFAKAISAKAPTAGTMAGDKLVGGIDKALKTGLKVAGLAGGALLTTALFKGFERLNAIDQAQAKLKGLGYDARTVTKIMNNATASVKGTAFGLGEAATVAAQITASGIKPGKQLESTLKLVADAATIAGTDMNSMGSIFAKVAAKNKLQADVMNQLTDAGIPILQLLAKHYNTTAAKASEMVSKGKVDFKAFSAAMKSGMGGAAKESGNTFEGAWKNTMASIGRIGANLLSPLFEGAKDGLKGLPELLAPLEEQAKKWGKALAGAVTWIQKNTSLLKTLGAVAATAVGILLTFRAVVAVMQAYQAVLAIVKGFQLAFAAASYGMAAATYAENVPLWVQVAALIAQKAALVASAAATGIATAAQWAFNAAMNANPITLIIIAIVALVAALVWFFTQTKIGQQIWAGFVSFFQGVWAAIKTAIKAVIDWFAPVWNVITAVFKGLVLAWLIVIMAVWKGIKAVISPVISWFKSAWEAVSGRFKILILGFKILFTAVFSAIRSFLAPIINWFRSAWQAAVNVVKTIVRAITPVFQAVFNGIRSFLAPIINWFKSAWNTAVSAVKSVVHTLKGVFTSVFNAITAPIRAVIDAIKKVVDWVHNLIDILSHLSFGKIAKIAGKVVGLNATAPTSYAPAVSTSAYRLMAGAHIAAAPRVGAVTRPASTSGAGGGIVININGGLDSSDAIARRVQQVTGGRVRRTRGVEQPLRVRR